MYGRAAGAMTQEELEAERQRIEDLYSPKPAAVPPPARAEPKLPTYDMPRPPPVPRSLLENEPKKEPRKPKPSYVPARPAADAPHLMRGDTRHHLEPAHPWVCNGEPKLDGAAHDGSGLQSACVSRRIVVPRKSATPASSDTCDEPSRRNTLALPRPAAGTRALRKRRQCGPPISNGYTDCAATRSFPRVGAWWCRQAPGHGTGLDAPRFRSWMREARHGGYSS